MLIYRILQKSKNRFPIVRIHDFLYKTLLFFFELKIRFQKLLKLIQKLFETTLQIATFFGKLKNLCSQKFGRRKNDKTSEKKFICILDAMDFIKYFQKKMEIWQPVLLYCFNVPLPCTEYLMTDPSHAMTSSNVQEYYPESSVTSMQKMNSFNSLLVRQLELNHSKSQKKLWTEEQTELLIQLKSGGLGWQQISQKINGVNPQICKRKYDRILHQRSKWSKEIDEVVIQLYQKQNKSWKEIFENLSTQWGIRSPKKLSQIKERYRLHLKTEISKEAWSIEEDILILNKINLIGKKWKKISLALNNRTELQVKNRYYGTLLPIMKRVEKSMGLSFVL